MSTRNSLSLETDLPGASLSNWAVTGFDAETSRLPDPLNLVYLDTSSPLLRRDGIEQLNASIFLRTSRVSPKEGEVAMLTK